MWTSAQVSAAAAGGHLATLTSQAENVWVYELSVLQGAWDGRNGPLLGGYKLPDNSFRWVTDEPWSFTAWLPGEPSSGLWEPYLMFLGPQFTKLSSATWNDGDAINPADGSYRHTYILEWSADCNADGVVDYGQILAGELEDLDGNGVPDCCDAGVPCAPCAADLDGNGAVDGVDLAVILSKWGTNGGKDYPNADIDGDGTIGGADLALVLGSWGACP
ncbi:MAG: hypothetical protein RIS86_1764 [Planctomycetota bacterium]